MADKTGFLEKPNYLDVGDLENTDYETNPADPENIDFGDLVPLMSYKELMELSTDLGDNLDRPNKTAVLRAVQAAEAHIDSKAALHYSVPLGLGGNVPPSIIRAAAQLFRYFMYDRRPAVPANILAGYEATDAWLNDIAIRRAIIPELEIEAGEVTGTDDTISNIVGTVDRSGGIFSDPV
jgi:phage gp36-like protein